jgi:hypothetical protein
MLLGDWDKEEYIEVMCEEAREETHEEDRQYLLDLLNQGLSVEEIKDRLQQQAN